MFSLFCDNELNFDVVSSPISYNEMKQQDTDFTMGFNPQSPSKDGDISGVDQDFFSDFSGFESTLTMSPGLGAGSSLNFNFQDPPQVQPTQTTTNIQKGIIMPDVYINRLPTVNKNNNFIPNPNVFQAPSLYPIPSTGSKENLNSNVQFSLQKQQNNKEINSLPKKQKLKRKCEVFQPFTSFTNLEITVKSLRNIVKSSSVGVNVTPTNTRIYAPPAQQMIASLA